VTLSLGLLAPAFVAANLIAREAVHLGQRAEPQVRAFLEGNMEEQVRSHYLIRRLHLENVPLRPAFEHLAKGGPELAAKAVDIVSRGAFELVFTIGITFFTMYYFFRDGPEVLAKLKYLSPLAEKDMDELLRRSISVSRATLKGTLLVALIKGTLGGLAFWAFGIPAPALWGVVMIFLSILPIVGPWLVMYPAALILLLGGHIWQGVALFLIASLVVGLVDNLLQPVLIGRDSGLPELIVFFSMVGGIGLFGVMGFLVGPVIAALVQVLLEIYGKEFRRQLASAHHPVQADS
jgi:predicted PurR-regulated permease PerM